MRRRARTSTARSPHRHNIDLLGRARLPLTLFGALIALLVGAAPASANPPVIADTWAASVGFSEASVKARVNPEGFATTFHIEYGPTSAYGAGTAELDLASDNVDHVVGTSLQGLSEGSTYHYRFVAANASGTTAGPDKTFTTAEQVAQDTTCGNRSFRVGASDFLPDCRAFEMVSPVDKNNGDIVTFNSLITAGLYQSARSGDKISFASYRAFGDAPSASIASQYLAERNESGWDTRSIAAPLYGHADTAFVFPWVPVRALTPELDAAFIVNDSAIPLTPDAVEGEFNTYRRDNVTNALEAVTTIEARPEPFGFNFPQEIQGFTDDGRHLVYRFIGSYPGVSPELPPETRQLYEWVDGDIRLVSVLPNGQPSPTNSSAGSPRSQLIYGTESNLDHAISSDGSRIFWSASASPHELGRLYVRIDGEKTVPISESISGDNARFWTASADGNEAVFAIHKEFSEEGDLYRFDVDTEVPTLIASKVLGVPGAADDLSYIYFVSREVLDAGATLGDLNLYVDHGGTVEFIATLPNRDALPTSGGSVFKMNEVDPSHRVSRVTSDGRYLVFLSSSPLTGFENVDPASGWRTLQVYRYDAVTGELICASCNPSGARPTGRLLPEFPQPFEPGDPISVSAWIPAWQGALYQPRMVSEDGRYVFFNSFDALDPRDTNGVQDVYQWRDEGVSGCHRAEGCISLLSTGKSAQDSKFVDADATGRDVFISTASSIATQDPGLVDIYDARIGGGFPPPAPASTPCVGDACQSIPAPPGHPQPSSLSFRGAGDPTARKASSRCRRVARKAGQGKKRSRAKGCRRAGRRAGAHRRTGR